MSTEKTQAILDHHSATLQAGDIDGVLEDYSEDSVLITNLGGIVKGLAGLRAAFGAVKDFPGFEHTVEHVDGDYAFITWKMDGIPFGTDTFVVRDDKIVLQTAAFHFG